MKDFLIFSVLENFTEKHKCWKNENDIGRQLVLRNKEIACSLVFRKKIKRNARFCKTSDSF